MACRYAKRTDEYHGWYCEIAGGACMYYVPNQKRCNEDYGEPEWPPYLDEEENKTEEEV